MRERMGAWWAWSVCAVGLMATGCPNPSVYGTPRTVPAGRLSHTITAEAVGYRFRYRAEDVPEGTQRDYNATIPVMPSYQLRVGLADQLDFGFRVANFSSLSLDLKGNFLKTKNFDLALNPMVQWAWFIVDTTQIHVPLLVGINFNETVSLVLTPGVAYGFSGLNVDEDVADVLRIMGYEGLSGRMGLGVNVRVSKKFAIQPEVTFLRTFSTPSNSAFDSLTTYVFGVGFSLGGQPDYSDLAAAPAAIEPAR